MPRLSSSRSGSCSRLGLFFVAIRGGLGGARDALQTQSRGGRKAVGLIFVGDLHRLRGCDPAPVPDRKPCERKRQVGGIKLNAAEKRGRELFGQDCAVCHTLAAANAIGKVGPNLDSLKPPASLVLNTINNGCVQNPPNNSPQACLGYGTMPAQLVEGQDARDVANFVAKVAGKE